MSRNASGSLAVRVLALLAVHPDGLVSSDRLGELLNANPVVVRRIMAQLKWDGLIEIRRGRGGGCALARDPTVISLGRVHRALHDSKTDPSDSPLSAALAAAEAAYLAELDRWTVAQVTEGWFGAPRNNESYRSGREPPHVS